MDASDLTKRFRMLLEGNPLSPLPQPRYPEAAVEIAPDRVTAVRVAQERKTGRWVLQGAASGPLPPGAIQPSLTRPNILAPGPVARALESVLSEVGAGEGRISLLLPDHVARVALLGFAALPRSRRELSDLVRFRMARSLPFKPDQAVMDIMVLGRGGGASPQSSAFSVLAAFVHRAILEQYEGLMASAGLWPGLVGLSTLELYNLFRPRFDALLGKEKDALLINVTRHDMTFLIFRDEDLIFYRCKLHLPGAEGDAALTALRREIYTSFAFYQEKLLGRGIGRVFLRTSGVAADVVREVVSEEAGCPIEALELTARLSLAEEVSPDPETLAAAAPAAGAASGRSA
ncbi:MAG: type IV pilus biogenesis protein PilM [Acidobacteriota bacterium]